MALSIRKLFFSDFYSALLISLLLFHFLANLLWIFLDTAPIPWDQAGHTRIAFHFANFIKDLGFLRIVDYFSLSSYYPPLVHTIAALPILIFGNPVDIGQIVISVFFVVSIVLVYILSLDLSRRKDVAVTAAFIYSFLPSVFELSRWFLLEIPLLTFILAAIICLIRSDGFSVRKYTIGFFIFASFGFLTKWLAFFYLIFPFFLTFVEMFKKNAQEKLSANESILKGLSIFILLLLPWYLINLGTLIPDIITNVQGEKVDPGIFSLQNLLFYPYLFINFQLTLLTSFFFFISLGFLLVSRLPQKKLIAGFVFFTYLAFTFISNKDLRYILPIAPFSAIIISMFLTTLRDKFKMLGGLILAILIVYLISYYSLLSFRTSLNITYQRAWEFPVIGWLDYINIRDVLAHSYNNTSWPQHEILTDIKGLNPEQEGFETVWVIAVSDQERFNNANLVLEKEISGFDSIRIEPPPQKHSMSHEEIVEYLARFKYALVTKENVINPATRNANVLLAFKKEIETSSFQKIKEYVLPNGDSINFYQLRP